MRAHRGLLSEGRPSVPRSAPRSTAGRPGGRAVRQAPPRSHPGRTLPRRRPPTPILDETSPDPRTRSTRWPTHAGSRVFLADDNLIVREGVRALLRARGRHRGRRRRRRLRRAGRRRRDDAARRWSSPTSGCRRRSSGRASTPPRRSASATPGTGVVILSQYDDPEYAVALLAEGAAGYAYLLKDRVARGRPAGRGPSATVATGGSMLDPAIVAGPRPARSATDGELRPPTRTLLHQVAEGKPMKAIAAPSGRRPPAVATAVEQLFLRLAEGASAGSAARCDRLRMLQQAIVDREEQGETLSAGCCRAASPSGCATAGTPSASTERLEVTVLMSDIRGYSAIAEHTDPTRARRSAQRPPGGDERGDPRRGRHRHAVRRRRGDGRVRGAASRPPTTPTAPWRPRSAMHAAQARGRRPWFAARASTRSGSASGCPPARWPRRCSGRPTASSTRWWATTVNLTQRLQQWADAGETVLSAPTRAALTRPVSASELPPAIVKGGSAPVQAFKIAAAP